MAIRLKKTVKKFSSDKKYLAVVEYGYETDETGTRTWDGDGSVYQCNSVEECNSRFESGKAAHEKSKSKGIQVYQRYSKLGIFDSEKDANDAISKFMDDLADRD